MFSMSETFTINFYNKEYIVAMIPDVFTGNSDLQLIIAASSLNTALYDYEKGYTSDEAQYIDKKIYAFCR